MNYKYDVSIILVNYNGKKYIDTLFQSLEKLKHDDFSFEVVFEDNASSDDSIAYLYEKGYNKTLHLNVVKSEENRGFAGGNNLGVEKSNGRYIVCLNNDTAVEEMWLQELYHTIREHPEYGMVNAKLVFFYDFLKLTFQTQDKILLKKEITINGKPYRIDNKFCKNVLYNPEDITCFGHTQIAVPLLDGSTDTQIILQGIKFQSETDFVIAAEEKYSINEKNISIIVSADKVKEYQYTLIQNAGSGVTEHYDGFDIGFCELDGEAYQKEYEINNGCGASIIMSREDFEHCGGYDEKFFMYYEDTDLSYRIKKLGKKIMFCPSAVVRHIHTGSSTEWSPFFAYHVYRNKLLFVYKNISKKMFWKYFRIQLYESIRYRDKNKLRATIDAWKISHGWRVKEK